MGCNCNDVTNIASLQGDAGEDGVSTAVAVTAEPAGVNCTNGGQKIDIGPDADGDGVPDAGTLTTFYVCNGAPGAFADMVEGMRVDTITAPGPFSYTLVPGTDPSVIRITGGSIASPIASDVTYPAPAGAADYDGTFYTFIYDAHIDPGNTVTIFGEVLSKFEQRYCELVLFAWYDHANTTWIVRRTKSEVQLEWENLGGTAYGGSYPVDWAVNGTNGFQLLIAPAEVSPSLASSTRKMTIQGEIKYTGAGVAATNVHIATLPHAPVTTIYHPCLLDDAGTKVEAYINIEAGTGKIYVTDITAPITFAANDYVMVPAITFYTAD